MPIKYVFEINEHNDSYLYYSATANSRDEAIGYIEAEETKERLECGSLDEGETWEYANEDVTLLDSRQVGGQVGVVNSITFDWKDQDREKGLEAFINE